MKSSENMDESLNSNIIIVDHLNNTNTSAADSSIFSFRSNSNNLDIKDQKNDRTYRVNFSREFSDQKFYHCFIIIYDSSDKNSYNKANETFLPLIKSVTAKIDFDFVLVMIGECNDDVNKEIPLETSQEFAINNGFFLLEMNFDKQSNLDLINKVLRIKISQSYMQYPEYYDSSKQTAKHVLSALKVFDFDTRNCKDRINRLCRMDCVDNKEEFLTFEEYRVEDKCDLETFINGSKNNDKIIVANNTGHDLIKDKTKNANSTCNTTTLTNTTSNNASKSKEKNNTERFEKHSFLKDLHLAKGKALPFKLVKGNANTSINNNNVVITNVISNANKNNENSFNKFLDQRKNSFSSIQANKVTSGHRRTYSENIQSFNKFKNEKIYLTTQENTPINTNYKTDSHRQTYSQCKKEDSISLLKVKINYKDKNCIINLTAKDTGESITKSILNHLSLKLDKEAQISLAKSIASKINKYIKYLCNDLDMNKYNNIIIDLNKLIWKSSYKNIRVAVTVNNHKLTFFININGKVLPADKHIDDIIDETIKNIDNCSNYEIKSLKEYLKNILTASIKSTLNF